MKTYTIDLMNIVDLFDMRELEAEDVGVAYIIRELWDAADRGCHFTKDEVLHQYFYFSESFDSLLEQGIISEVEL